MPEIRYKPIGLVRSPFSDVEGMPIQAIGAVGVKGTVELDADLEPGLKDLEGFSHIILIYDFHLSKGCSLHVHPFLDTSLRGVFSTRVPRRPNSIGLSVVRLTGICGNTLTIEDVDILDRTPVLDIKPFVPAFDNREVQRAGWFTERAQNASEVRADRRFVDATKDAVSERHDPIESRSEDMERILIVGCKKAMDDVCIGCSRCLVGFNRREGEFSRYKGKDAVIMGLLNCGDCPGATIVTRLAQVKLWNAPMGETATKIHLGPCITDHCPHKETLVNKIKAKAGIEVVEGTHPYKPENIFA